MEILSLLYGTVLLRPYVFIFLAFYLARWLGRPFVARWVRGLPIDSLIERYGAWGILLLRLFPVVSFDFVSFAAGLTVLRP